MKKIIIILTVVISMSLANKAEAQFYGNINFNTFYNELSPYGRWVNDLDYGQVWIADEPGFEPYYNNGHWVYTSYGWTWISDYRWGWAPFHYGRWTYLPTWGEWAWVPGYEWGPAWVGWCQNDGYYGWAPLSPGIGMQYSYNSIPHNYWRFVPQQYIGDNSLRNRIVRPDRNNNQRIFNNAIVINNTQVNNNVTYSAGPKREAVERVTRQKIETRPVAFSGKDENTKVDKREVRIYRPDLQPNKTPGGARVDNNQKVVTPPVTNTNATKATPQVDLPVGLPEQQLNKNQDRRVKQLPSQQQVTRQDVADEPGNTDRQLHVKQQVIDQPLKPVTDVKSSSSLVQQQSSQPDELRQQRVQQTQQRKELQDLQPQRVYPPQPNEQKARIEQEQVNQQQVKLQNEQRQNEIRQQQAKAQQEQLKQQQAVQQPNEQRQNEIKQQQARAQQEQLQQQKEMRMQQLQEQRMQQQRMQQQERLQRQNEIRQQPIQNAQPRPQRQAPMKERSKTPFGN